MTDVRNADAAISSGREAVLAVGLDDESSTRTSKPARRRSSRHKRSPQIDMTTLASLLISTDDDGIGNLSDGAPPQSTRQSSAAHVISPDKSNPRLGRSRTFDFSEVLESLPRPPMLNERESSTEDATQDFHNKNQEFLAETERIRRMREQNLNRGMGSLSSRHSLLQPSAPLTVTSQSPIEGEGWSLRYEQIFSAQNSTSRRGRYLPTIPSCEGEDQPDCPTPDERPENSEIHDDLGRESSPTISAAGFEYRDESDLCNDERGSQDS